MNDERVRHRFRPLEHVLCDKSIADFVVFNQVVFAQDFDRVELGVGVAGGEEDVGGVAACEGGADVEVNHFMTWWEGRGVVVGSRGNAWRSGEQLSGEGIDVGITE